MRLAAYVGVSTALAAGVIIYAFNQRANFYSACVYLSQSNLCLMILSNLILLIMASLMFGLQRIFYGPLRPIEIEQLYEKAWFAVTETCLAMTIFREEVGAWFLVMFVALLAGEVWGWIGEGRVEVLEQQPPANPRLVHIRLSLSLALSLVYDIWILGYTINTVIQQARPNMMVMFLFEFAILTMSSSSTALRYCISLAEARIIKQQTVERLEWRRREVRQQRVDILGARIAARRAAAEENETIDIDEPLTEQPALPSEDDVDEMDIEVPGWEAKGQWVLTLDLLTDFFKLGIYTAFFVILLSFYGIPLHIMRDLFLTARSFIKRLTAFLRYRKATHDMNERYPDATVEEIQREDTCIICREEMRPWSVTNPAEAPAAANGALQPAQARRRAAPRLNERSRPKKLPCGHVLHLGCLKSWLERQQVCPTCRRPVVDNRHTQGQAQQAVQGQGVGQAQPAGQVVQGNGQAPQANGNLRMIQFGPIRVAFGQANNIQDFAQRLPGAQQAQQEPAAGGARLYGLELGFPRHQPPPPESSAAAVNRPANSIQTQLLQVEQQIMQDLLQVRLNQNELQIVQQLQAQLARHRSQRRVDMAAPAIGRVPQVPQSALASNYMPNPSPSTTVPRLQQHAAVPGTLAIPSGSPDLPPGLNIPEGWTLLPLQRLDQTVSSANGVLSQLAGSHPAAGNVIRLPETVASPTQPVSASTIIATGSTSQGSSQAPVVLAVDSIGQVGTAQLEVPVAHDGDLPSADQIEDLLPNWDSSQVFGTPGAPIDTPPTSVPESPDPGTSSHTSAAEKLSSDPTDCGANVHTEGKETLTENLKGKGRAATVEDSNEDS